MRDDLDRKSLCRSLADITRWHCWRGGVVKVVIWAALMLFTLLLAGTTLAAFSPTTLFSLYTGLFTAQERPAWNSLPALQVATNDGTTIKLISAVSSSSHTLVELMIEDPQIIGGANDLTFLPLREKINLKLSGFDGTKITGYQASHKPGRSHILLELPPLLDFDAPASIEIVDLRKWDSITEHYKTLPGPWRFEFTPKVPPQQRFDKRFPINQTTQVGDTKITLEKAQLSSTETIIHYRIEGTPRIREGIGAPKLYYADHVIKGRSKSNTDGDSLLVRFPAVPRDIKEFKVVFGPFFSSTGDRASLAVELPPLDHVDLTDLREPLTFELDQVVPVGAAVFRFTSLTIEDSGFRLVYEPANENDERFVLAGPGSIVSARDDLGNIYPGEGQGTQLDLRAGTILMWQSLEFSGTLSGKATRLTIESDGTGVIGEAPFEFLVNIPD